MAQPKLTNLELHIMDALWTRAGDGDLVTVDLAPADGSAVVHYTYDQHRLLTTVDPRGNPARTSTYYSDGRLHTDTDALSHVTSYAYDLGTRTTSITHPDTGVVTQVFDDRGLLLSETDPLGRTTTHEYDGDRNETARTNALNETTHFGYDARGNQRSTQDAANRTTSTRFNDFGQATSFTDQLGHVTTVNYDDRGLPTLIADEIGTRFTFASSEQGVPLTVDDAAGHRAYLTYDGAGNVTSMTDWLSRVTRFTYDEIGRRITETSPRGNIRTNTYNPRGTLDSFIDTQAPWATAPSTGISGQHRFEYDHNDNILVSSMPFAGRSTTYAYDALNRVSDVQYGDGATVHYTRDFRGNKLTEIDEASQTSRYEYDLAGQLLKTTFPDTTVTRRGYDDLGRLTSAIDERGNTTTYEYEAACGCSDRVTKVTDALGRGATTTYDAKGRRESVTDAGGRRTSFAYDVRDHLIETTSPDDTTARNGYDARGLRVSTTNQTNATTLYGYDDQGQLISATDALGNVTAYSHDLDGNLVGLSDANHHTTSYEYDLLHRQTKRTLPIGGVETFAYDPIGNQTTHTDFSGKTTTLTYDARDRLLSKIPDPSLGEPTITYTYFPRGTRSSMTDASGLTTYTYDARDRLLTKTMPAGTLTYTHDASGNVATIRSSNANGTSVDYTWDVANQLVSVTDNRAGGVTTAAYTATGRRADMSMPNGVGMAYAYDNRDRVTSLAWQRGAASPFASWAYTYSARGQRLSETDVAGRNVAYGYDAVSRLVSEAITNDPRGAIGNGALTYPIDAAGNRLSRASTLAALGPQTLTYDANDQLTADSYDPNGNTTSAGGSAYGYDFENRLASENGSSVTLVYDGDHSRVAKTAGGVTTRYLVDDLNPTGYLQVLEEVSGGVVQTRYTYGSALVSQTRNVSSTATTSYYGYDATGNVTFLTDSSGTVTDSYDYDAWGNVVASTGSTPNTRLYGGEEFDTDLGLINLRARYYSPGIGRFLTADPASGDVFEPISLNRYLYADADPRNREDPLGLLAPSPVYTGRVSAGGEAGEYASIVSVIAGLLQAPQTILLAGTSTVQVAGITTAVGVKTTCNLWRGWSAFELINAATEGRGPNSPPPPYGDCRVRCQQYCKSYHRGGDALHNRCADKLQQGLCTGDVNMDGKDFDAADAGGTLWEVKTKWSAACRYDFLQSVLLGGLFIEQEIAHRCGHDFKVLVNEPCLKPIIDGALGGDVAVFRPASWC